MAMSFRAFVKKILFIVMHGIVERGSYKSFEQTVLTLPW